MITLTAPLRVSGNYKLTDDIYWTRATGAAVVVTGPATIDLNGHRIIGVGGADNTSMGVYAQNQSNVTVKNGAISGFSIGVNLLDTVAVHTEGFSQSNNSISGLTIRNCTTNGFMLGGNNSTVDHTVIIGIGVDGSDLTRAYGGQFYGPNATFSNSRVAMLAGGSESVGISFSGRLTTGATVVNSVLDGRVASGQSFGIWSSDAVPISIVNSYIHHWDYAVGGPSDVLYSRSTFANNGTDFGAIPGGGTDVDGRNSIIPPFTYPLDEDVIIGDATGQRYKTGPGNDFLAGMEGHDHLFGRSGSDIFAYITQAVDI